jgi:cell division protein FtsX
MHPKVKSYSDTRNVVYASKLEEQKKLEQRLKEKYKLLKNDTNTKR